MFSSIAKKIINVISRFFAQNYILFESKPDYSDNTRAVYDYIIKNNLFPKYKKFWVSGSKKNDDLFPTIRNEGVFARLKYHFIFARAKLLIYCNVPCKKVRDNQISVFLAHGSKSKNTRDTYNMPQDLDYMLIQADMFKQAAKYGYRLSENTKMITLGYPRNDDLLTNCGFERKALFECDFDKVIVWYPTFRQNGGNNKKTEFNSIPIIHDVSSLEQINNCAKKNNVLIVLKPHFAQNVSYIKKFNASNFKLIDNEFLSANNIRSYQLLFLSDALLTDYSSVYYDYLLTDNPIGLVWEDYDLYKEKRGFALDADVVYSGGEKIFNADDFCGFIERLCQKKDVLKEERKKIRDQSNVYQDANSTKRVCEFLESLL